jgi:hypothetical protein
MTHPFFLLYDGETRKKALAELPAMINKARVILDGHPFVNAGLYIGHSGGKDSVAVTYLTRLVFGILPILHSAKPKGENAVHPEAQKLIYAMGEHRPVLLHPRDVVPPPEYATQIDGTKMCEFDRTDGRHTDVMIDGELKSRAEMTCYVKNGLFGKNFIFPIFDWQDYHVWALIYKENLAFSGEYLE